ncbi:YcaO-like family protein [Allokutzneria sp. A3M-2-11 16]|uniref:YcaO-like family protein n=1 Tax=Allokutzneria sp. A3M-2-11 16 TaxID=2962043 RepID=UPI0020B78811|nr:YcaO-like family protein [Allokutzneria sp. A3M-2-11 16]MCP3805210.1 YcaO-like family protein [Allokutzneria sp. A3M-2-11 16]
MNTEGRAGGVTGPLRSTTATTGPVEQRLRSPEQTLAWLAPRLRTVGITRLADLTWLDEIGIPVYQAVRPNAWLLSVSQGKGLTRAAAKVGAAMEAIELWHAERVEPDLPEAEAGAAAPGLGYRMRDLDRSPRTCLNPALRLRWNRARRLDGSGETRVPTACLRLDGRVRPEWTPPVFAGTTNGLASGNTLDEAIRHGLTEVIERDAVARHQRSGLRPPRLRLDTVDGPAAGLLARFADAEVEVLVEVLDGPCGVPCFGARIFSEAFPVYSRGYGCHLDPQTALCRALTEAAQSRVTYIAGTRDDVGKPAYRQTGPFAVLRDRESAAAEAASGDERDFGSVKPLPVRSPTEDNALMVERVLAATGVCPFVVDLTRADLEVPVARVVAPRLLFPQHL